MGGAAEDVEAPNAEDPPKVNGAAEAAAEEEAGAAVDVPIDPPKVKGASVEALADPVAEGAGEGAKEPPPPNVKGAEVEVVAADDDAPKDGKPKDDDTAGDIAAVLLCGPLAVPAAEAEAEKPNEDEDAAGEPKVKGDDDEVAEKPRRGAVDDDDDEGAEEENMEEEDVDIDGAAVVAARGAAVGTPNVKGGRELDEADDGAEEEKENEEDEAVDEAEADAGGTPKVNGDEAAAVVDAFAPSAPP